MKKRVFKFDLIEGKVYRNPNDTVKLLYIGIIDGRRHFKIIEYFNGDFYAGKNIGDTITQIELMYQYFIWYDKDNYIKFGR